jgi:hypothetical protein
MFRIGVPIESACSLKISQNCIQHTQDRGVIDRGKEYDFDDR